MDRQALIIAIATRAGTAAQLAKKFGTTVDDLRDFVEENREAIELAKEAHEREELENADLWITEKPKRLAVYQKVADDLYAEVLAGNYDPTVLRELRFYLLAVGNETGQLLHRGAGTGSTGDSVRYEIEGVDMDLLK